MTVHRLRLDDLEPHNEPLPPGAYRVRIDSITESPSKDGALGFRLRMTVVDGEHSGATIVDRLFNTPKAKRRIADLLLACDFPIMEETEVDFDDLVGREVQVVVVHERFNEPDGQTRARACVAFRGYSRPMDDLAF